VAQPKLYLLHVPAGCEAELDAGRSADHRAAEVHSLFWAALNSLLARRAPSTIDYDLAALRAAAQRLFCASAIRRRLAALT